MTALSTPGFAAQKEPSQSTLESLAAAEHPQCLMCSAKNPFGMKLKFMVQSDGSVMATFLCQQILQSYPETLHGGVVSSVLDAAMTNVLFATGVVAVTAELTVRLLAPVQLGRLAVVRAWVESSSSHPLYLVRSELEQEGKRRAHASAKFLVKGCMEA